jgi:hypothetical protein
VIADRAVILCARVRLDDFAYPLAHCLERDAPSSQRQPSGARIAKYRNDSILNIRISAVARMFPGAGSMRLNRELRASFTGSISPD